MTKAEKVKAKKDNWKIAKKEFLKDIPKRFKVELNDIERDNDYYHPTIKLNDNITLTSQGDINTKYIYGVTIGYKYTSESLIHNIGLDGITEEIAYVLNNWDKVEENIINSLKQIKKIVQIQNELNKVKNNIMCASLTNILDKKKLKESTDTLYAVTEFIENQRLSII